MISNIVWERVGDRGYSSSRSSNLRDYLGRRMEVGGGRFEIND